MADPLLTTFYFVRHGQSVARARNIVQGVGLDIPLTEAGLRQAEAAAARLAGERFDRIFSSRAKRCRDTAAVIRRHHPDTPYEELGELNERSKGEAEGMDKDAFAVKYPEIIAAWSREEDPRVPGGESFADVETRAWPVIERLLETGAGSAQLVVGHGNVFRVVIGRMLGVPHGMRARIAQGYCAVSVCTYDHDRKRWSVECLNRLP
jgi:broad specificity phosphatase PhoE